MERLLPADNTTTREEFCEYISEIEDFINRQGIACVNRYDQFTNEIEIILSKINKYSETSVNISERRLLSKSFRHISDRKQEISMLYLQGLLDKASDLDEKIEIHKNNLNAFEKEKADFESKMIVVFSIVLSMLGFVFSTFSISFASISERVQFVAAYVFAISLFVAMIRFVLMPDILEDSWKHYIIPVLCAVLSIVVFFIV